jgi:hypothetical protein
MFACILLTPLCFITQVDKIELKEVGISLPNAVGDIKYQSRQAFDSKALGYSVGYANKMCKISLIVYDLDQQNIPDGKAGPQVEDQMKRSIADVESAWKGGSYKNLQRMKDELPLSKEIQMAFSTAGFTFDIKGGACKSYILVTGRNKHFLKIRLTQFVVDDRTNDEEVAAFLEVLEKAIGPPAKR